MNLMSEALSKWGELKLAAQDGTCFFSYAEPLQAPLIISPAILGCSREITRGEGRFGLGDYYDVVQQA